MSDLSLKTTRGIFWSLAENLSLQVVQLAISIVLARLLLPSMVADLRSYISGTHPDLRVQGWPFTKKGHEKH